MNTDFQDLVQTQYEKIQLEKENRRLQKENVYLRRLALHALSAWAIGMSLVNHLDERGSRKKQIAYFMVSQKFENLHNNEKQKWRKENERQKTISH